MNYYNDFDSNACLWLEELIRWKLIPDGVVDSRSITEITASDLRGFTQVHFFSGIGGWPLALQLAGWPEDRPVWTGSAPCQPFSAAGKGLGTSDERHLWPVFFELIRQCRPPVVFGEQVASSAVIGSASGKTQRSPEGAPPVWLDGVFADLEGASYACAAADLPAASIGAPHIRQRLWWTAVGMADAEHEQRNGAGGARNGRGQLADSGRMGQPDSFGSTAGISGSESRDEGDAGVPHDAGGQEPRRMGNTDGRNTSAERQQCSGEQRLHSDGDGRDSFERVANDTGGGRGEERQDSGRLAEGSGAEERATGSQLGGDAVGVANPHQLDDDRARFGPGHDGRELVRTKELPELRFDSRVILCRDGKHRRVPVERSVQYVVDELSHFMGGGWDEGLEEAEIEALNGYPLARKIMNRSALLKGAGNAIVPGVAAAFIQVTMEVTR